jgi:uncharacterized protein (TIGR02246 family)
MRKIRTAVVVPVVVASMVACGPTAGSNATDSAGSVSAMAASDPGIVRQAIEAANAKGADAFSRSDTAGILANFADDAVVMQSGVPMMTGRAAIAQGLAVFLSEGTISDVKFNVSDVIVKDDIAIETGTYEMTLTPKGGKAMPDTGKYITVWKRQADGSWKIIRDISNSDRAPAG